MEQFTEHEIPVCVEQRVVLEQVEQVDQAEQLRTPR